MRARPPPSSPPPTPRFPSCPPPPTQGLGKTIQVISLFALLREKGVNGPFLVVAPLATLPNWVLEVRKWLPSASVCLYHGTVPERQALREEQMPVGRERETSKLFPIVVTSYEMASIDRKHLMR